jgi:hypothetical protein
MLHGMLRNITFVFAAIAAASVALLWSWNTLAELFGAPIAEYRHVVAVLIVAIIARSLVTRRQVW